MATHTIELRPAAYRELARLPVADRKRVAAVIEALAEDPRPEGCRKLAGASKGRPPLWRVRAGAFRVVYQVQDQALVVLVVRVAHRRDAYKAR